MPSIKLLAMLGTNPPVLDEIELSCARPPLGRRYLRGFGGAGCRNHGDPPELMVASNSFSSRSIVVFWCSCLRRAPLAGGRSNGMATRKVGWTVEREITVFYSIWTVRKHMDDLIYGLLSRPVPQCI
ncbi:unnamed protein product [Urochloa humidicola]